VLFRSLCEEVAGLWKAGGRLSLLLADIDRFKAFNDSHGHQIGDEVLRAVGRVLKDLVKGRDTPARCGGEAFAVILPDTALADALKIAEQIRARLAGCEPRNLETGEGYGRVTLSLGVAQYRLGEPLGELIQRADRALYRAKRAGRNRVAAENGTKADFHLAG
jgi:diguanylate cyclase